MMSSRRRQAGVRTMLWLVVLAVAFGMTSCGRRRPAQRTAATPPALVVLQVLHLGLSPSGEWLTFEGLVQRGPDVAWAVSWLMPATGGLPVPLAPASVGSLWPVWSPVAEELAYVRVGRQSSVRTRSATDPMPKISVDFGSLWPSQLSWSPDGTELACLITDVSLRRNDPVLIDASTGEKHFARLGYPAAVSPLLFTATGEQLVFARGRPPEEPGRGPTQYLMELNTADSEMNELVSFGANVCQLAVPVAGKLLVQLVHGRSPVPGQPLEKEMALVTPGRPDPVRSLGDGSFASAQSLRRRNDRLELVVERGGDLFIRNLLDHDGEPVRITETPETETGAVFSPNANRIYFIRGPSPTARPTQVVVRDLDDGSETILVAVTPRLVERARVETGLGAEPAR